VPPADVRNPIEAAARLNYLTSGKDQDFIRRFNAGDPAACQDFEKLATQAADADDVDRAMAGVGRMPMEYEGGSSNESRLADMIAFVKECHQLGMPEENIANILRTQQEAPEAIRAYKAELDHRLADKAWIEPLKAKQPEAMVKFLVLSALISPTEIG
jgi:hypothetical protein